MYWTSKVPFFPHFPPFFPIFSPSLSLEESSSHGRGSQLDYVEGHGTGTKLGDPLEVAALTEVLGQVGSRSQILVLNVLNDPSLQLCQEGRILLGSVKGNMGHLNTAAGESRVGIKNKIFQTSGVRWKLFIVFDHSSWLSLSLSSFQECLVLWSQRLSLQVRSYRMLDVKVGNLHMSWHKTQSPRAVLMLKHQSMVPSLHAVNPSVEVDWNRTFTSGKWFFRMFCRLVSSCNCLSDGIDSDWPWLIFVSLKLIWGTTRRRTPTFFRGHLWVSRPCQKAGKVR